MKRSWSARDEEVRALAYQMGFSDALSGLPEDPEPATILGEEVGFADYLSVWTRYVEGRVDGGADLPF